MKKILIILFLLMFSVSAYADAYVSGGTVEYTSRTPCGIDTYGSTGQTVTFNSVANYVYLRNEGPSDCRVNVQSRKFDAYDGGLDYYTVTVAAHHDDSSNTSNVVELNVRTKGLSFYCPDGTGSGRGNIVFIVTGDRPL